MSTSGSASGCSTPSTHLSDEEWEEVTNAAPLLMSDLRETCSAASGSSREPYTTSIAKLSVMENLFRCLAQHVHWAKNQKQVPREVLLEVIGKALYEHDFNPTDIVDYIGKAPRNLPKGKELIKLRELHHARDNRGNQYGEKRQALNLCEEVMNLCVDVYLDVDFLLNSRKAETEDVVDIPTTATHTSSYPSDDEWEKVINKSTLPEIDVMKSSATSGSSQELANSDVAKLSAMQNVFLVLKVHVDPLHQKPLSRKMMLEYISVALYDHDLNPSEIIDYIGKTPRVLPRGEKLLKLKQFNQSRDSNGIQYGEKRPAALDLCEEVMNLCIDVYLDEEFTDTYKEETKLIEGVLVATTHTTANSQRLKEKEVEIKFNPAEGFIEHATPSVTFASYHPAKLQTCVPPLKRTNGNDLTPPNITAPLTALNTEAAPIDTSRDLLVMAKKIHAEADMVNKLLNKPASTDSLSQAMRKPKSADNVVWRHQLPNMHSVFKEENPSLCTQFEQGKRPFKSSKFANPSSTSGGLSEGQIKPRYARSVEKKASLWKANMIYTTHGLPTQKSFTQQLSDQLDNPPYGDRRSNASLWSKNKTKKALLAHELKPGDVDKDEKLIVNSYSLNHHYANTEAALSMAQISPVKKSERPIRDFKDGMARGKPINIEAERRRTAKSAKAHEERQVAGDLIAFVPMQRLGEPSVAAAHIYRLGPTDILKDGQVVVSLDPKRLVDTQKSAEDFFAGKQHEATLTPTQKFEKTLTDHAESEIPFSTFLGAGYPNNHLTGYFEKMKHATVSEAVAKKNAASKAKEDTDSIPAMEKGFKEGPVISPTKEQFEQGQVIPPKKEQVTPREEVRRAAFTEDGDDSQPTHWAKIARVLIFLFLLCTFIQVIMNIGTIMSISCNVLTSCLVLLTDYTSYFWSDIWWLIRSPFILFGYIGGLSGILVNKGIALRSGHTYNPPNEPLIIVEAGAPLISAMAETISLWDAMGKEKAKHPQSENSLQISSEVSADSSTGIRYKSVHSIGNGEWTMFSDHPFTRHNNSLPEADRCEHFVKSFQHFWREELEEKKEKVGTEVRFDLSLGNELAMVLSKHCK